MKINDIDSIIHRDLISTTVPSCTYVVVSPNGIVASGAVGLADLRQSRLAKVGTAYHLFSATKLYTATAIMQLVEADKLSMDAAFTKILPEYQSATLDRITIEHLLSHSSGLSETLSAVVAVRPIGEPFPATAEVLKRYKIRAKHKPGTKVEYLNVNFVILGEILERISSQTYVDYVTEHILQPLGANIAFSFTEAMRADMATGYVRCWDPTLWAVRLLMPGMRWVIGDRVGGLIAMQPYDLDSIPVGGLVGPVEQFAPFLVAHLNNGDGLLKAETALKMRQIIVKGQAGFDAKVGMGLGWKIGDSNGSLFFNHEGSGAGFATETRIYPEKNLGIVLMTNGYGVPVHRALHQVCETISNLFT